MTYVTYKVAHSGGGNFKVCIADSGNATFTYTLKEIDGKGNSPETVGRVSLSEGECKVFYVGNYVDGSNHQAELALTKGNDAYVVARFWD
ncbi:hypothetical protein [Scopulibacillus darangshiensis]|nr:hypothetical protein [Scopulibacillus darangshiensis]